uniref:ANK_REP_REGION domain-containing protein n=1 Tax=Emiliania huxleyi TaxID=2903 RepID=A0A7S3RH95_EMIHU
MCTALDNYNVLRYLRVLVRSRLAEDAGGGGNADATAVDRFLAALMAWLKLFTKVEKSQSDHARLRGLRAIYMRCGKAAFGGSFGETSKNHDLRHSEAEEAENGTWQYHYDGSGEERQKLIKMLFEHATNRHDSDGASVEAQLSRAVSRWEGLAQLRRRAETVDLLVVHVCRTGDANALRRLLQEAKGRATAADDGTTALECACREGHTACVRLLLAGGANIAQHKRGAPPPLLLTLIYEHRECERLLRQHMDENLNPREKRDILLTKWRERSAIQLSNSAAAQRARQLLSDELNVASTLIRAAASPKSLEIGTDSFDAHAASHPALSHLPLALQIFLNSHVDSVPRRSLPRVAGLRLRLKAGERATVVRPSPVAKGGGEICSHLINRCISIATSTTFVFRRSAVCTATSSACGTAPPYTAPSRPGVLTRPSLTSAGATRRSRAARCVHRGRAGAGSGQRAWRSRRAKSAASTLGRGARSRLSSCSPLGSATATCTSLGASLPARWRWATGGCS